MALPVFAARTRNSVGCGEFLDLLPLLEFADASGMRLIQVRAGLCCVVPCLLLLPRLTPTKLPQSAFSACGRQSLGRQMHSCRAAQLSPAPVHLRQTLEQLGVTQAHTPDVSGALGVLPLLGCMC